MSNLGMGVMLSRLGGNEETVNALKKGLNKIIKSLALDKEADKLCFEFTDGYKMSIFDDGQSCCESRYMTTDDDLSSLEGQALTGIELKSAPDIYDKYGAHEVQFLVITTDQGQVTLENHNEHNGYYGGFAIVAREE